jgi:4,4'-diaponeurosporenoate glycosyltransferase
MMEMHDLVIALGLFYAILLFWHFPTLSETGAANKDPGSTPRVSIIVPVRNEAHNLPQLLASLKIQTYTSCEIICVDDGSTDGTDEIIKQSSVRDLWIKEKPPGWMGKSYACHVGASQANGELLLFLDADVLLETKALESLVAAFDQERQTLSVLPYHCTKEPYEQASFLFNLIQYAGNGVGLPLFKGHAGLFGPVILIEKNVYSAIGGHESIKASIVDDVALGERLKSRHFPFELYMGRRDDFSYRMYPEGFRSLLSGWEKNQVPGAMKTPPHVFMMVFLFISSLTSVVLRIGINVMEGDGERLMIYLALYVIWVLLLFRITKHLGRFSWWSVVFYPVWLLFFYMVFFASLWKNVWGMDVKWKDRNISTGGR